MAFQYHIKKYGLKHNNNPVERYNEDVKQRYKIMRGKETRAMKAGIALELGQNRLLNLIKF